MVALGLLLLVLATAFTLGTVFTNGEDAMAEVFGVSLSGVSVGGLFLAGVVAGVVGALGLFLLLGGTLRKRRSRKDVKATRGEASHLAQENARLKGELDAARTAPVHDTGRDRAPDATRDAAADDSHGGSVPLAGDPYPAAPVEGREARR